MQGLAQYDCSRLEVLPFKTQDVKMLQGMTATALSARFCANLRITAQTSKFGKKRSTFDRSLRT